MSTPSSPKQHNLRLTECATALAHQTAERCVAQHVLCAIWPEHFEDIPCRLERLWEVLLLAAQTDLVLVPWLSQRAGWPYDVAMHQHFAHIYTPALVRAAQRELLAWLSNPHHWFHAEAEERAHAGLRSLEHWSSTLARYRSSCQGPLPCQPVPIAWPLLRRAVSDVEAADGLAEWRLCIACGAIWRVLPAALLGEAQPGQQSFLNVSVHAQPVVLRIWSLVDVFCDWLHRLARCSNEERAEIQRLVEQVGVRVAPAALPPQAQTAWDQYLEVCAHLAVDRWLQDINHLIQEANLGAPLCWAHA